MFKVKKIHKLDYNIITEPEVGFTYLEIQDELGNALGEIRRIEDTTKIEFILYKNNNHLSFSLIELNRLISIAKEKCKIIELPD